MSLPRPAPLADLPALTDLSVAVEARASALRSIATHVRAQDASLARSWTSPSVDTYRTAFTGVESQLTRSATDLEGLEPAIRSTRSVLEAGDETYRRLVAEWGAIDPNVEPELAAELRRRIRARYDALVAELEAAVRSLNSTASGMAGVIFW